MSALAHMLLAVAPVHHDPLNTDGVETEVVVLSGVLSSVEGAAHIANGYNAHVVGVLGAVIGEINLLEEEDMALQGVLGSVIGAINMTVSGGAGDELTVGGNDVLVGGATVEF